MLSTTLLLFSYVPFFLFLRKSKLHFILVSAKILLNIKAWALGLSESGSPKRLIRPLRVTVWSCVSVPVDKVTNMYCHAWFT